MPWSAASDLMSQYAATACWAAAFILGASLSLLCLRLRRFLIFPSMPEGLRCLSPASLAQGLSCFTCVCCDVSAANGFTQSARPSQSCSIIHNLFHTPLPLQWISASQHAAATHALMPAYCAHECNQSSLSRHRAAELQL